MKDRIRSVNLLVIISVLVIGYVLFSLLTEETANNNNSLLTEETVAAVYSAGEDTTVSVSVPDGVIGIGEQCTISITVEQNKAIAGMQFDMKFDPSLISIDSVEEGGLLTQDGASTYFNPGVIDSESGVIRAVYGIILSPGKAVSTEGTFAIIRLTAGTTTEICPLTLLNVVVGDLEGNSIPVKVINDNLEVSQS